MPAKVTPVLRYPGGKSKALKTILEYIPNDFNEFREPFVGGGSVFISVKQNFLNTACFSINDINPDLYHFWHFLKEDGENFKDAVISFKQQFSSGHETFNYFRSNDIEWDKFERAVRFFIMNRITFSGLIDSGGFSQESYEKRFTDSVINKLIPLSNLIKDVEITNKDYNYLLEKKGENVFIFLDPPYFTSKESKLYGKNGSLHTKFDHERFAKNVRNCSHRWLITCDDSPEVRELFDFAYINSWELKYGMTNVHKNPTKKGQELIITPTFRTIFFTHNIFRIFHPSV